ncbi:hypothetical protein [Paenibacillus antibioticophila]|uniref:hypothetical protein n=1 Tax=Paenibacillus antibioticophila TaxID=1274374 RepID=UPI0013051679|nr:hypothetical protein [Paenibacillus antibioticophila]
MKTAGDLHDPLLFLSYLLISPPIGGMMTLIGVGIYFWSKNKSEKRRMRDGNDRGFLEA